MSLKTCFEQAARMGVITRQEADALAARFDELAKTTTDSAELRARMQKEIEAEAAHKERAALLTQIKLDALDQAMSQWRDRRGNRDDAQAFVALHENVGRADITGAFIQDAEGRHRALFAEAQAKLAQVMHELARGKIMGDLSRTASPWLGGSRKQQVRMANMAREVFGESTNDPIAKAMAKAVTDTLEDLRIQFNAAGGAIGKLEGGYLPQWHNAKALEDFGQARWVRHMMRDANLDRERMRDHVTGQRLTDAELEAALNKMWERVVTEGWVDIDVNQVPAGTKGALYTQRADHRFIHFKNADAHMAYAKRFGSPDTFGAIMGHISSMTRDIAHMQTFGPNPNRVREIQKAKLRRNAAMQSPTAIIIREAEERIQAFQAEADLLGPSVSADLVARSQKAFDDVLTARDEAARTEAMAVVDRLQAEIEKAAATDGATSRRMEIAKEIAELIKDMREPVETVRGRSRVTDYTSKRIAKADAMWDLQRGQAPESRRLAENMRTARNFISATSLGAAWISSLTDVGAGQDARLRIGMGFAKANFGRLLVTTLREMFANPDRQAATEAMLGLDSAQNVLMRRASEVRGIDHQFWSGWIADRTLTAGLLSPWTQAGKHMMGMDTMRHIAGMTASQFGDLTPGLQSVLRSHGIDKAQWDILRTVPKHEGLLRANEIMPIDRELGLRYVQMLRRETLQAVPESTVESRSIFTKAESGSYVGEIVRSAGQFKGFALAVFQLKLASIARDIISANPTRMGLGVAFLVTSTLMGAVAMALKDMKDGRDPRKWLDETWMADPKMWGAAFLQAGGLGIYGDLLFSEVNRFGGGLAGTMSGPLVGRIGDVLDITAEINNALNGKKTHFATWGVKQLRRDVPFMNHWATSLIYQRMVMDQLQKMGDPEAYAAFERTVRKRQTDYGQAHWWRPGTTSPQRAPDLGRIGATR